MSKIRLWFNHTQFHVANLYAQVRYWKEMRND